MRVSKFTIVGGLVLVAAIIATIALKVATSEDDAEAPQKKQPTAGDNVLSLASQSAVLPLVVSPPAEFDFMSREQIYELRRSAVAHHRELVADKPYSPSPAVYGRIADGKPWWGLLGICYFGPGQKSIEGPSEESRMVLNPFVLLYVQESFAVWVDKPHIEPFTYEPLLQSATWTTGKDPTLESTWDLGRYFAGITTLGIRRFPTITMANQNARDFGFRFYDLDSQRSSNISPTVATDVLRPTKDYIHAGRSCRYPGGCNNASPTDHLAVFRVTELPARAVFKLWRSPDATRTDPPDAVQVVILQ